VLGGEQYRLVDVSSTGFKALSTPQQAQQHFAIGREIQGAYIMLGSNARVDLAKLVPRSHHQGVSIGFEFEVSREGASAKYLNHLLSSLTKAETDRMSTES